MRIVVTYENGQIFEYFGSSEQFKIYDVEDGKVIDSKVVTNLGSGYVELVRILRSLEADILICGNIGLPAQVFLEGVRIKFFGGASGDADKAVEDYLAGNLVYDPHIRCKYEKVCGYH